MVPRHFVASIAALLLFVGTAALGQAAQEAEAPACASSSDGSPPTVLLALDGLLTPGISATVDLVGKLDGKQVLRERHQVVMPKEAPATLAVGVAGLPDVAEIQGTAGKLEFEVLVDGQLRQRLTVAELVEGGRRLAETAHYPVITQPTGASLTGSFTCPEFSPYCQDQYNYCYEVECEYGNRGQVCVDRCIADNNLCVFGDRTTSVTKTLQASQPLPAACAFYPWYQFANPKLWAATQAVFLNQRYESIYCQPTNEVFVSLIEQWTESTICYSQTSIGCSGNAFYLGGYCRW